MEEKTKLAKNLCCFGCLCTNDENYLHVYNFECAHLRAMFQANGIYLCHLCKRMAQHAELFIQNVQSNQILMENFHSADATLQTVRNRIQPLVNLTHVPLVIIELSENDRVNIEESFSVIYGSSNSREAKVKLEMKEEDNDMPDHLEGEFINEDDEFEQSPFILNSYSISEFDRFNSESGLSVSNSYENDNVNKTISLLNISTDCEEPEIDHFEHETFDHSRSSYDHCSESDDYSPVKFRLNSFSGRSSASATKRNKNNNHTNRWKRNPTNNLKNTDHENVSNRVIEFQDSYVKEEELKEQLKEELELHLDLISIRNTLKERKVKKKHGKKTGKSLKNELVRDNVQAIPKIERKYITKKQCMQEREQMAKEKKYLNSTYKCQNCIKGFTFKESYEKHLDKHSESRGEYICNICKQRMNSEEKLISHKKYHTIRYKCPACDLTRVTRLTIKEHYTALHSHGNVQYVCPHCSKTFKRQVSLRKHIGYMHREKERVSCAYCHKSYANKEVLKSHMIVRHPKEVSAGEVRKRYNCQDCDMAFRTPSQLKNHRIKHSHSRNYYCVECDKSFKSDSILKHHLKTAMPHVNYIELPLVCLHCEKRFAIRRDLDRHMNRVHLNIKPFQCDRCDKAYVNGWSLTEHKRLIHEGYKRPLKFPCPMCDKVFDRNQILKGHIRTHTGERPYQCSKCPAQFSQASILGTHVKLIHLKLTRDGRPKAVAMK